MKYVFVYPDRTDPDMTKVSLPAGFKSDADAIEAAQGHMRLYPPWYTRILIIKLTSVEGESVDRTEVIADLVTTGQTDSFPYRFQGIYDQHLGEMAYVS